MEIENRYATPISDTGGEVVYQELRSEEDVATLGLAQGTFSVVCEGSGNAKLVPQVLCCCGESLTVVDNKIPVHYRTGPIVNGESSGA